MVKGNRVLLRRLLRRLGRVALFLALVFMALEMVRVQGWGAAAVAYVASTLGWSPEHLWAAVAAFSVATALILLVVGLVAGAVSRRLIAEDEDEKIDVAAVSNRIRAFEDSQLKAVAASRRHPISY